MNAIRLRTIFKGCIRKLLLVLLVFLILLQLSCKKWLDKKPSQDLAVPETLSDLQALLDNTNFNGYSPGYPEFLADNYYLTNLSWNNIQISSYKAGYVWNKDIKPMLNTWMAPYEAVYNSNFVLDFLPKIEIKESERNNYNNVKGIALFFRAFMFHQLAQLFCKPYHSNTADNDLGIVLRLTSAVEASSTRSSVQQTYDQVIHDLKEAAALLPVANLFSTRPNKAAAYGALARAYLSMRNYDSALVYSDRCLSLNNTLLDYKTLTPGANSFLPSFINNPEVLFYSIEGFYPGEVMGDAHKALIDSFLYQSYDDSDLRKTVFFGANPVSPVTYYWRGSYFSSSPHTIFDGIAVDEIYLIRAECRARKNNKDGAMDDLNELLRHRWKGNQFVNLTATDTTDALNQILTERRKELLFRGLRWSDLRRFNLDGAGIELKRVLNGTTYRLPPGDLRWVLLIPDEEITRSGIEQNPR